MLRSSNPDPIAIANVPRTERAVGVVFPGPAVSGALVYWRCRLTSIAVNLSASMRSGVRVPRISSGVVNVLLAVPSSVAGVTIELSGVLLLDLQSEDHVELQLGTSTPGIWLVDPYGFSVDVR